MDPTKVEDYMDEAFRLKRAWEDSTGVPTVCHNNWMLDWHAQTKATYYYADQYWAVVDQGKRYGMYAILH